MRQLVPSLLCVLMAAACGGGNNPDPTILSGGGVANGGIDGTVHVYVIDTDSEAPIQGAAVDVGTITGTTDANGLFTASGDSLSGPQDITATASGYSSATWYGANGANVTIPLSSSATPTIAQATLTGSITGWDQMTPPSGQAVVALVGYSDNGTDGDPANTIQQPQGNPPPNLCFKSQLNPTNPCAWSEITRTGSVAMFAYMGNADINTQAITLTGFAYKTGLTVADGVDQSGISLDVASASDLSTPSISLPSAPSGTDTVNIAARLDLGDDGRISFPLSGQFVAPTPKTSLFSGSSYQLIGAATSTTDANASSVELQSDLSSLDGASLSNFQPLPGGLSGDGSTFTFSAVTGASIHIIHVLDANGNEAWSGLMLSGATTAMLPSTVTLPSGTLTYQAQALTAPAFDPENFVIDDLKDTISASSQAGVTFTN